MKIEVLFPEMANLYGDLFNIRYLKQCLNDVEIIETKYHDEPYFVSHDDVDMLYMGPMSENSQSLIVNKLMPHKKRLEELIDKGIVGLFTGNALELLGAYIENEDGSREECLGIFKTYAKRAMLSRYNQNVYGEVEGVKVCGFVSSFSKTYSLEEENNYLFDLKIGKGIDGGAKEGFRKNNFMATYLVGPLLCINPEFTKFLLKLLKVENINIAFEEEISECFNQRLKEFEAFASKEK